MTRDQKLDYGEDRMIGNQRQQKVLHGRISGMSTHDIHEIWLTL